MGLTKGAISFSSKEITAQVTSAARSTYISPGAPSWAQSVADLPLDQRSFCFQLRFPEVTLKPANSPFFSWSLEPLLGLKTHSGVLWKVSELGTVCLSLS